MRIISVKKIDNKSKRYDIEVEKNHNFFANNILVHNSSMSLYYHKGLEQFGVCSRNLTVYQKNFKQTWQDKVISVLPFMKKYLSVVNDMNGGKYNEMAKRLCIEQKMRACGKSLAIQGELIGPGIQQNKYKLNDFRFVVFSIYDIDKEEYLGYDEMEMLCDFFALERVPLLDRFTFGPEHTIDHMVGMSSGKSVINNSGVTREGIVVRPVGCQNIPGWTKCSFKAISPEFLIKYEE